VLLATIMNASGEARDRMVLYHLQALLVPYVLVTESLSLTRLLVQPKLFLHEPTRLQAFWTFCSSVLSSSRHITAPDEGDEGDGGLRYWPAALEMTEEERAELQRLVNAGVLPNVIVCTIDHEVQRWPAAASLFLRGTLTQGAGDGRAGVPAWPHVQPLCD
jgi:hypothetical protein